MREKLRRIGKLYLIVFIFWGLYRLIFRLPEEVEEIILKPIVWLGPTFYLVFKVEKKGLSSLGYSFKSLRSSLEKGLIFGILFLGMGLILQVLRGRSILWGNLLNYQFLLSTFGLALMTALSEETVFRGYILNRLEEVLGKSLVPNIITSIGFALIHLPVSVFVYHLALPQLFSYLLLVFLSSMGSGLIFSWSGGIWGAILVHVFLVWPMILG